MTGKSNLEMNRQPKSKKRIINYPDEKDWLDRLAGFNVHFGRFARDVFGVGMVALALMSLLALLGQSKGVILTPWSNLLSYWFGWGSILIVVTIAISGFWLLRRNDARLNWGRIIQVEVVLLLTLGVLSLMSGNSLEKAISGRYGGVLGWGLARAFGLIGPFWGGIVLLITWIVFFMSGFGLWERLEKFLMRVAGDEVEMVMDGGADETDEIHQGDEQRISVQKSKKRKHPSLPPEFRKSLSPSDQVKEGSGPQPQRKPDLPPLSILLNEQSVRPDERTINQSAGMIEKTLSEFGIPAQVIGFRVGPTVTQFAVQPGFIEKGVNGEEAQRLKVRVAQIASLHKDLALALSAERLRIQAPVPGRSYVGIEVPNVKSSIVRLRPLLETENFYNVKSPLAIALGRDVSGYPVVADLANMPHLLIAGSTGSGKSVCITSIASCLAMNNSPDDLRMVMIDSKMVELIRFNGLPHMFGKVETDVERIMGVLRWVVVEMESRYKLLEIESARDLAAYNRKVRQRKSGLGKTLSRIVVMIDELADLMMHAPDQTEHNLVRLAQMARATGIHLVVATQRPSTDVVTGLIKANFPARLAFAVAAGVDSRVILDMTGAETLLGRGDMLFLSPEDGNPIRAQGVMITDQEIEKIITYWQQNREAESMDPPWEKILSEPNNEDEGLIDKAIDLVRQTQRASASLLQRRLRIGYPRAARLLDQLEELGIVGPSQGGGRERDILVEPGDEE